MAPLPPSLSAAQVVPVADSGGGRVKVGAGRGVTMAAAGLPPESPEPRATRGREIVKLLTAKSAHRLTLVDEVLQSQHLIISSIASCDSFIKEVL